MVSNKIKVLFERLFFMSKGIRQVHFYTASTRKYRLVFIIVSYKWLSIQKDCWTGIELRRLTGLVTTYAFRNCITYWKRRQSNLNWKEEATFKLRSFVDSEVRCLIQRHLQDCINFMLCFYHKSRIYVKLFACMFIWLGAKRTRKVAWKGCQRTAGPNLSINPWASLT